MQHTHTNTCVITFYALWFPMSLAMHFFFGMRFSLLAQALYFFLFFNIIANKYLDQSKKKKPRDMESQSTQRRVWKIFFFLVIILLLLFYMLFYCSVFFILCFYLRNILKTAYKTGKISLFFFSAPQTDHLSLHNSNLKESTESWPKQPVLGGWVWGYFWYYNMSIMLLRLCVAIAWGKLMEIEIAVERKTVTLCFLVLVPQKRLKQNAENIHKEM